MNTDSVRVLIVDDEPDTCENLSDILTDMGYQVDTAPDGFAALELAKQHHYDIALLDLRMPGMDGLELYRRIRETSAGTEAIVVTAYASSDTARSVLAAGACKIMSKPVDIGALLSQVAAALDTPLVLVVDDDRDLCDNLWDLLHERGYRVRLAHDIPDAEQALRQSKFHVVLIDMKLPAGDGHGVLQALRQADKEARAILITGCAAEMETKIHQALQAGADAVCYKPFDIDQLLGTVRKLCGQQAAGLSAEAPRGPH
jgi:two-component system, NtrC family, response regulator HydG